MSVLEHVLIVARTAAMVRLGTEHLRAFERDGYLCAPTRPCPSSRLPQSPSPHELLRPSGRVIEDWFPEETRVAILDAMHQWVAPRPIPDGAFQGDSFPYDIQVRPPPTHPHCRSAAGLVPAAANARELGMGAQLFNEVIMDPDLLAFIAMALDSEDIHLRYAHNWGAHSHISSQPPSGPLTNCSSSCGQCASPATTRRGSRARRRSRSTAAAPPSSASAASM